MITLKFYLISSLLLFYVFTFAQVQVDHPIQLTGSGTNAKLTGIQSVTNGQDAASAIAVQSGSMIYATATGSGNNFSITISPPISAYQKGMVFNFISNQTVTGQATLDVNNLGAITITKSVNQNLGQCDIQNGQFVTVAYDGINFQMPSAPVVSLAAGVSIAENPSGTIVQGTSVTFTATPTNGGSSPTYQWIVNGGNVGTGGTTYTTSSLNNGDLVSCVMTTSSATCGSPATSNTITAAVSSSLLSDIVAYWKMDESSGDPVDATGNGHTLTNNNSCPFSTAYGVINNGVSLNGTNQDLTCSDASFPAGTSDRTFAFWIKFTSTPTSYTGILSYGTGSAHEWVSIEWQPSGELDVSGYSDDNLFYTGLSNGAWYHVAVTISVTGSTITLYINGAQFGSSTGHAWNTIPGGTFYLASEAVHNTQYLPADMDEVGVWSRALSASEISELYNGGVGLQYPF